MQLSPRIPRGLDICAVALFGLLIWAWFGGLDLSLWRDEIVTVERFVESGPGGILLGEYTANNHVLFSVLTWATATILGYSEPVLRLWSVLPATAAVGLVWWWLRHRSPAVGLFALALMVASSMLLTLAPQGRGYGLAFLGMALMIVGAAERRPWILASGAVVGAWTLPVFVIPAALIFLLVLATDRDRRTMGAAFVAGALVAVWYAPRITQVFQSAGQDFGSPLRWHSVVTSGLYHSGINLPRLVVLLLLGAGAYVLMSNDRRLLGILLVSIIGTYVVIWIAGFGMVPRFLSYLVVPTIVLSSFAIEIPRLWPVLGVTAAWLVWSIVPVADNHHDVPIEALREAAVAASSASSIYTNYALPDRLAYYTETPIEKRNGSRLPALLCEHSNVAVIRVGGGQLEQRCSWYARHEFRQRRGAGQLEVVIGQ